MKRLLLALSAVACLCLPILAAAQMPSLPSFGSKPANSATPDLETSQVSLVKSYVGANKDVLTAQSKLLAAVGLKDKATAAQATADALSDGATKGNLSDANKVTSDNSQALSDTLKSSQGNLDAESKKTYTQGLLVLASGVVKYTNMRKDIDSFKSGASSASPLMLPKIQAGTYIVTSFPTSLKNLTDTLTNAVNFAKDHGIEVPAEATSAI